MEGFEPQDACPKCGNFGMKGWNDLTDEERLLAERLPASAEYTSDERRSHRFCPRCWNEIADKSGFA